MKHTRGCLDDMCTEAVAKHPNSPYLSIDALYAGGLIHISVVDHDVTVLPDSRLAFISEMIEAFKVTCDG